MPRWKKNYTLLYLLTYLPFPCPIRTIPFSKPKWKKNSVPNWLYYNSKK